MSAPGVVPAPARPRDDAPCADPRDAEEAAVVTLGADALRSVLQPVVDLRTGEAVAHEALLRGPAGTPFESPLALIAAAREAGRSAELDVAALRRHLTHAGSSLAGPEPLLFVNLEPTTLSVALDEVLGVLASRPDGLRLVVEFTERALATDPAAIIDAAERIRETGCAVALDDVGAEPASLAFVPLLRPEVVKLDLRLLRTVDDPATITVAHAVRAYAEEFGRDVVAEGVETAGDRTRAVVLGATLGQGWLWGRPDPAPRPADGRALRVRASLPRLGRAPRTPFELLRPDETQAGPKELLLSVSRGLELAAVQSRVPPVLLSAFQDVRNFGRPTARRYSTLARDLPLVGVLGHGMAGTPSPGVRGASIAPDDDLAREWTVVVLGAHEAIALIARIRPDGAPGGPAAESGSGVWFDFAVTHDRARVTEAALLLLERLSVRAR
ncbi:hypothetical protein N867_17055 [Actinotalea fermentans ATCC 43279 = JCM 9966 = DSM 3133]|nr:hypothetical protein N867_17055 [Actinotalea fermentans ATCC 43279 = JCM 9966 = DSM 3133]